MASFTTTFKVCIGFLACLFVLGDVVHAQLSNAEQINFFEKKVRPVLVACCLECHSTDSETNGGLSLDAKSSWLAGGDSGPAIDLAEWQKSLLWIAIDYRNPKLQMPPSGKLSDQEKEILRIWLTTGAFDPREATIKTTAKSKALPVERAGEHWAYRYPLALQVPNSTSPTSNVIDSFLAPAQVAAKIEPSQRAPFSILRQRLYVDLHGIRPNLIASQLEDRREMSGVTSELNYQQLIDDLLTSPRFGERFARHWMDAVRFAESITLRGFVLPDAWRYRNYLIDSFNRDKAISEFFREQIAGDLMQSESQEVRREQWIGTTMLTLGDTNLEEQDKKQLEMDHIDEQLDLIGKVFLAQTIGCARCHDHKFDPIPTRDYYALAGIMKSSIALEHSNVSKWVSVPLPTDRELENQYKRESLRLAAAKKQLDKIKKQIQSLSETSLIVRVEDLEGVVIDDTSAKRIGDWEESTSIKAYVNSNYLHDKNQGKGDKSVTFEPNELKPGAYRVRISYTHGAGRSKEARVRVFSADGEDLILVDQEKKPADDGLWHTLGTYRFEQGGQAFVIISNEESKGHVVADAVQFLPEQKTNLVVSKSEGKPVSASNLTSVEAAHSSETLNSLRKESAELDSEMRSLQSALDARPMVMSLRTVEKPADLAIHIRGNVHQLGQIVPRGFLSCLPHAENSTKMEPSSNGRLELANWLASDQNSLTARVYVNRVWSWLMGDGIVRTLDNFGTTGELPSNQGLLDWLTIEFIRHDWSTKWLIREILQSDAYQRSSDGTADAFELDPDNRLFARGNVRRLDAESIRDTLLDLSGELDLSFATSTIPAKLKDDYDYKHSSRYRSVYGPWFRNSLPDLYSEFDGANPSFPIAKRNRSTIATQALALLNSDWIAERTRKFGARLAQQIDLTIDQKIDACFHSALSRYPSESEMDWAKTIVRQAIESHATDEFIWSSMVHNLVASIDFRYVH